MSNFYSHRFYIVQNVYFILQVLVMKSGLACGGKIQDYFQEGDMLFAEVDTIGRAGIEGVINHPDYDVNWAEHRIPYEFDETVSKNPEHMKRIVQAMQDLMNAVPNCVSFEPKVDTDEHWVKIQDNGNGCSSAVGNQSWSGRSPQPCQMSVNCRFGSMVHEFLHTMGFFHEQTRDDRDQYVQVLFENIKDGHFHNFKKDGQTVQDRTGMSAVGYNTSYYKTKYNYDSIMHYPLTAFSKDDDQPTMIHKKNKNAYGWEVNPGQREKLSEGDLQMIINKYGCDQPPHKEFILTFSEDFADDLLDEGDEIFYNVDPTTTRTTDLAITGRPENNKECKHKRTTGSNYS